MKLGCVSAEWEVVKGEEWEPPGLPNTEAEPGFEWEVEMCGRWSRRWKGSEAAA